MKGMLHRDKQAIFLPFSITPFSLQCLMSQIHRPCASGKRPRAVIHVIACLCLGAQALSPLRIESLSHGKEWSFLVCHYSLDWHWSPNKAGRASGLPLPSFSEDPEGMWVSASTFLRHRNPWRKQDALAWAWLVTSRFRLQASHLQGTMLAHLQFCLQEDLIGFPDWNDVPPSQIGTAANH